MVDEYQPLVDAGDLFVWAAGNSGGDKLNYEAAVPAYEAGLQKGWLAVVNVQVDNDGKPTILDPTSDACGVAAQWCLAAPGAVSTTPVPGTRFDTGFANGTSGSAAIVTGIAAQVWEAFPWMTGTDVQQTLLTTATPLGGAAPNATFGWGVVNAGKAVDGPAQFAFGAFDANVGSYNATFSNAIAGTGSLVLTGGSGSLTLSADNTYTGGTQINGATLHLPGSVASDVTVVAGGALVGDGRINGNVSGGGLVSSVSSTDGKGLTITGNYTPGAGGYTSMAIGNPLTVGGTATLGGTVQILAPSSTYTMGATETLLHAGTLTGTFANQTYGPSVFYAATLHYGATDLTADLTRTSVTQSIPLPNPAMASTAKGIDSALAQADQWSQTSYAAHSTFLNTAASFLSAKTQSQAQASVQSLGGEIYGTTGVVEAQQARLVDDALALRQNSMNGDAAPGVWAQALTANGSLYQDGFSSARYHSNGMLIGGEAQITDNLNAGVAFGSSRMDTSLAGLAGQVNGRDDTVGIYGRYDFGVGAYLAGRGSWSHERLDVNRSALIGSNIEALGSTRTDGIGRLSFEFGKAFQLGGTSLTPYVALSALRINQAAFTESGAGGFGLTANSNRQTATLGDLGLRYSGSFDWAGGQSVLTGYAAYRRVLAGANLDFTAALAGAPTATFSAMGQDMARNTRRIGMNLSTQINQDWDWFVNADAQAARGRAHGLSANAGVRFHF